MTPGREYGIRTNRASWWNHAASDSSSKKRVLFPAWDGAIERRLGDLRKTLTAVCGLAGLETPVTTKTFRHTFCSAAVQTLDHGQPISLDTVRRWMGHGDEKLVRAIYGHLGTIRHRADVVEFRFEQHIEALGDRVARLRARASGTGLGTDRSTKLAPVAAKQE